MSPLPAPGLLAAALAWVLGGAAPTLSPATPAPGTSQILRPGGSVIVGGLQVLAPASWSGNEGTPDQTTVHVRRVARADLEEPLDRGVRLATPIYTVGASPAVFSGWQKSFTVRIPRNPQRPASRLEARVLTWIQVDAAPPHPGGSIPVWITPEHWRVTRDAVEVEIYHLLPDGLVMTVLLRDVP